VFDEKRMNREAQIVECRCALLQIVRSGKMNAIFKLTMVCALGAGFVSLIPAKEASAGPVGLTASSVVSLPPPIEEVRHRHWRYRPYGYYYRPYYPRYYARPYYGYPVYGYPPYGYPAYGGPYMGMGFGW
jgi:hypothetical protein